MLGGSWVAMSRARSTLSKVISIATKIITLLITAHEPPSGEKMEAPERPQSPGSLPCPAARGAPRRLQPGARTFRIAVVIVVRSPFYEDSQKGTSSIVNPHIEGNLKRFPLVTEMPHSQSRFCSPPCHLRTRKVM